MTKDEQYESVRPLILHTIKAFKRRYGGEFNELLSEANEAYMDAVQDYNQELSKFSTWVRTKVWLFLKTNHIKKYRPKFKQPETLGYMDHLLSKSHYNRVEAVIRECSVDAVIMVSLVLEPYEEIAQSA